MKEQSFRTLGVSVQVERVLAERGIVRPFPIQELVLPDALAGRDVLGKSPTGSGKTLAFAVPIVTRVSRNRSQPAALVLVPTRELAGQVSDEIRPLAQVNGLRVAAVFGGAPVREQAKKARSAQILVATPGRLQDLVERRLVSLEQVGLLAHSYTRDPSRFETAPLADHEEGKIAHRFVSVTADGKVEKLVEELSGAVSYTHLT